MRAKAGRTISEMLRVFAVAMIDGGVIQQALQMSWPEFEDSVTAAAAQIAGCDLIVTRDPKGFRNSPIPVMTPEAAAPVLLKA